jgi:HAE1 family hydrophobic/amphiphilic exporter-1
MAHFFIDRPIVAMVISIILVIVGAVAVLGLPVAQFPNIVPPEIQVDTTYVGADAETLEKAVATPLEQQMSGVDNLGYMFSLNSNSGSMRLRVNFDVKTDPNIDQVLTQIRQSTALSQLPADVRNFGVTVNKSYTNPLMLFALYSPKGTYDATFLANYANINLNDALTRVPGISRVLVFGADPYAIRCWVRPDLLAKLDITVPEIVQALQTQNAVNPAGQVGGEPIPAGQEFTYAVRAQGRLTTEAEFGNIVLRARPGGAIVRLSDVARIELGAQGYSAQGRLDGRPAAVMALYQLPGSNALDAASGAKRLMAELKTRFPEDLDYVVSIDTTLAVTEGVREIVKTLLEALALVIVVVYIFLQGWRATMIPLLAVPVSLVGAVAVFPLLGFSINTLSLFGLVLAIGLVVDDAIVVVEAVEHHIEEGLSPRDAARKAMDEVSSPVVAIALILAAVFIPTVFIPGITGRLYQQFAVTIAISVIISAFNALSLSPALAALLLRPRQARRGPLGAFFRGFNRIFAGATEGYVRLSGALIRKSAVGLIFLAVVAGGVALLGKRLPSSFLPDEDQGFLYLQAILPNAASMQRTDAVGKKIARILLATPGVAHATQVNGLNLLAGGTYMTYGTFFFVNLKPWEERTRPEEQYEAIKAHLARELARLPEAIAFPFPPPPIPGVGTAGGVTFVLEDRGGNDLAYLAENTRKFIEAARKRPEIATILTTFLSGVPQRYADVDRDKALEHGVDLGQVYLTLQSFMGGAFVNYFNRFGRQWQVYVEAEGAYRTKAENVGQFYVRNRDGTPVPLETLCTMRDSSGPEFTMRYNLYRSAQINCSGAPGRSSAEVMRALEAVFDETMPRDMGYDYLGISFQEQKAQQGVPPAAIFGLSLLFVFLILAAQYESWSLPFSVLLGTPVAALGAFLTLWLRRMDNDTYAQIGLVMLIGLAAKNAILIVEFAKAELERGRPLADAALAAARVRLRPIVMTAFAFILGCVPLWTATGAGAVARRVLGSTVIGGMLAATLIGVFVVPLTFYVVERLAGGAKGGGGGPAPAAPAGDAPS